MPGRSYNLKQPVQTLFAGWKALSVVGGAWRYQFIPALIPIIADLEYGLPFLSFFKSKLERSCVAFKETFIFMYCLSVSTEIDEFYLNLRI